MIKESTIPTPEEMAKTKQQRNDYEERANEVAKKEGLNKDEIITADAKMEDYMRSSSTKRFNSGEQLNKLQNSDLTLEPGDEGGTLLKGNIEGKNVEIEAVVTESNRIDIVKATIDNKKIPNDEAEKMWYDWYYAAEDRMKGIAAFKQEKDQK